MQQLQNATIGWQLIPKHKKKLSKHLKMGYLQRFDVLENAH